MNPAADPQVIAACIAAIILGALALFVIPHPCSCKQCAPHTQERLARAEKKRAKRHREAHAYLHIPWGDPQCNQCQHGYGKDRDAR